MGWYHSIRRYYGHIVDARKTGEAICSKIREDSDYTFSRGYACDYEELKRDNLIIFYVYEKLVDHDHGTYSNRYPDTTGSLFAEPQHPTYIKEQLELPPPELSEKALKWLDRIKKECVVEQEGVWVEIAAISY